MTNYSALRHHPRRRQEALNSVWQNYLPTIFTGLLAGLLISAGLWIWHQLNEPQTLPFREIRINGQFQHVQAEQLRGILSKQIHKGFFALKLEPLKQSLINIPWVEDVAIRRIPGILFVTVKEHQPIAQWNAQFLIDSHDQLFAAPADSPKGLPLLQGPSESANLVLQNYKEINQLLKPLQLQLQRITLDKEQSWEVELNNGILIGIGRDDVLERMQRLIKWYPKIINDKVNEISHIDLRYSNSIAVQFKNRI
jgi:cell division protein FtsQ